MPLRGIGARLQIGGNLGNRVHHLGEAFGGDRFGDTPVGVPPFSLTALHREMPVGDDGVGHRCRNHLPVQRVCGVDIEIDPDPDALGLDARHGSHLDTAHEYIVARVQAYGVWHDGAVGDPLFQSLMYDQPGGADEDDEHDARNRDEPAGCKDSPQHQHTRPGMGMHTGLGEMLCPDWSMEISPVFPT
ncbi:Uncharacterised protein [Mycobacteroides abscessus subsp. abscessus]|nr:Uncharacterised protein [Mycobacteroides abscessus subsp. abscessus]